MKQANPPAADGSPRIADSADGVHIEYRVRGNGAALVVLVHGWSCDSNYWRAQLPALTPNHTVMTVDLAGHGASGRNRSDWSMRRFGEDVVAAVRDFEADSGTAARPLILVGHSMGGPVIVEAARLLGAPVRGLIGVDTFKFFGEAPTDPKVAADMMAAMRQDFIGTTRQFVTSSFFWPDSYPELSRQIANDMSSAPPEIAIAAMVSTRAWFEGKHDLSDIKVPVIAINGDMRPTDDAAIRRRVPTFRSVTMQKHGHFLMMEDPAGFNPLLLREIEALLAPE
jgi:pimeloyl-ACP methyl ester carboxylesterase